LKLENHKLKELLKDYRSRAYSYDDLFKIKCEKEQDKWLCVISTGHHIRPRNTDFDFILERFSRNKLLRELESTLDYIHIRKRIIKDKFGDEKRSLLKL
jgi:hypothetical protein